jgi:D-aminoacyl-tRNA deacylase
MKAVLQRVSHAEVEIDGEVVASVERGLLVLLGVEVGDTDADAEFIARKIVGLRVFQDAGGKMNLGVLELDPPGSILAVSNFTVCGDARRGRRPSFTGAAAPEEGLRLFDKACALMEREGATVAKGVFGAHMHVRLENDGPVTLLLESSKGSENAG